MKKEIEDYLETILVSAGVANTLDTLSKIASKRTAKHKEEKMIKYWKFVSKELQESSNRIEKYLDSILP
jgi:hypothetical protein